MRGGGPIVAFLSLCMLAMPVSGAARARRQAGSGQSGADDPTVFRIDTRLVEVDVVVRDANGPVDDLSSGDFRLYSDGEERQIGLFGVTRAEPFEADAARARPSGGGVTNRPESDSPEGPTSATILLLDRLNTAILDQPRANAQALAFLTSLDGDEPVAIYELTAQLRLVQDYTTDRNRLIEAALSLDAESSSQLRASYGTNATGGFEATGDEVGLDPDLVDARTGGGIEERGTADLDQLVAAYYVDNRIRVTAEVLQSLGEHMSGLRGRKNLIWLAGRFPFAFDPRSRFLSTEIAPGTIRQVELSARVLTDANVAVYPVSAAGLLAPTFNDPSVSPAASAATRRRAAFSQSITSSPDRLTTEPVNTNSMEHIAGMTGGQAYFWTNGIAEAIGEAVSDSRIVYTLGFYPDAAVEDSDFHTLRVEVDRSGVDLLYRRGYYGFATPADTIPDAPQIQELVASPVNATGLGIRAIPASDGSIRLLVDVRDLEMALRDGVWYGAVEIGTLMVSNTGKRPIEAGNLRIALDEQQLRDANAGPGYELFRVGPGASDAAWFRVVVRDRASRRAGSLWVLLD